jgi:hypothetical protein
VASKGEEEPCRVVLKHDVSFRPESRTLARPGSRPAMRNSSERDPRRQTFYPYSTLAPNLTSAMKNVARNPISSSRFRSPVDRNGGIPVSGSFPGLASASAPLRTARHCEAGFSLITDQAHCPDLLRASCFQFVLEWPRFKFPPGVKADSLSSDFARSRTARTGQQGIATARTLRGRFFPDDRSGSLP